MPARPSAIEALLFERLRGAPLVIAALAVWIAGAAYCMGYEALISGDRRWAGSLLWSAHAVMPWFAIYEWAKGRQTAEGPFLARFLLLCAAALLVSLGLEWASDTLLTEDYAPLALQLLRRVPAILAMLVLLAALRYRAAIRGRSVQPADEWLAAHAAAIDWVKAADNYIEVHSRGRVHTRRATMMRAEKTLAPKGFVRIHRSYLANGGRIAGLETRDGKLFAKLDDDTALPVGKRNAARLKRSMNFATSPQSP